jgi:hypothetical protein
MSTVTGGLRSRFLHDSLSLLLENGLTQLGWLDPGRHHQPFQFLHGPHTWDVPVTYNAVVITTQAVETDWIELGSWLSRDSIMFTVDVYAESESFGLDVTNDMRELLRGRLPNGAQNEKFPILDFRMATPAPIGYADVINVSLGRGIDELPEDWARHLYTLGITIYDTYY